MPGRRDGGNRPHTLGLASPCGNQRTAGSLVALQPGQTALVRIPATLYAADGGWQWKPGGEAVASELRASVGFQEGHHLSAPDIVSETGIRVLIQPPGKVVK